MRSSKRTCGAVTDAPENEVACRSRYAVGDWRRTNRIADGTFVPV
jgi:hypothetical protein